LTWWQKRCKLCEALERAYRKTALVYSWRYIHMMFLTGVTGKFDPAKHLVLPRGLTCGSHEFNVHLGMDSWELCKWVRGKVITLAKWSKANVLWCIGWRKYVWQIGGQCMGSNLLKLSSIVKNRGM
jgi:hypothetical protein